MHLMDRVVLATDRIVKDMDKRAKAVDRIFKVMDRKQSQGDGKKKSEGRVVQATDRLQEKLIKKNM